MAIEAGGCEVRLQLSERSSSREFSIWTGGLSGKGRALERRSRGTMRC